jgi:polyhydroxyalkanoate synthesis regulator phasin
MRNIIKLSIYASMGLYDRVREIVDDLVKRGELMKQEGEELIEVTKEQETAQVKGLQERLETALRSALEKMPKPASAKDVAGLETRIRALEAQLETASAAHPGA